MTEERVQKYFQNLCSEAYISYFQFSSKQCRDSPNDKNSCVVTFNSPSHVEQIMQTNRFPLNLGNRCRILRLTKKLIADKLVNHDFDLFICGLEHFNWYIQDFYDHFSSFGPIRDLKIMSSNYYQIKGAIKFEYQQDAIELQKKFKEDKNSEEFKCLSVSNYEQKKRQGMKLYVCQFDEETTEWDLRLRFMKFGELEQCSILKKDFKNGVQRKYAVVVFKDKIRAEEAMKKMNECGDLLVTVFIQKKHASYQNNQWLSEKRSFQDSYRKSYSKVGITYKYQNPHNYYRNHQQKYSHNYCSQHSYQQSRRVKNSFTPNFNREELNRNTKTSSFQCIQEQDIDDIEISSFQSLSHIESDLQDENQDRNIPQFDIDNDQFLIQMKKEEIEFEQKKLKKYHQVKMEVIQNPIYQNCTSDEKKQALIGQIRGFIGELTEEIDKVVFKFMQMKQDHFDNVVESYPSLRSFIDNLLL